MMGSAHTSSLLKAELLVQVCPSYVDLERETGGVANIVRQICLRASGSGRKVLLLCGNRELSQVRGIPGVRKITPCLEMEVYEQGQHPLMGPTRQLSDRLSALDEGCVVHVHTCFSAFTEGAMGVLTRKRIPFIFTPHGKLSPSMLAQGYWAKRLWWMFRAQRVVREASRIGLSSIKEIEQLQAIGINVPFEIIPNGYELPSGNNANSLVSNVPSPFILFLGYLDPRKQPEFLVEAYAESEARKTHYLVLAGPDSYSHKATIESRIARFNLQDRVIFYGSAYGDEKWSLLNAAACLCLPSKGEGLPVVLCEALGAGVPTVYSEASNFPEIAGRGAGIMITGFESFQWARAIDAICLDGGTASSMRKAAAEIRPSYAWNAIVARWCDLYDQVYAKAQLSH